MYEKTSVDQEGKDFLNLVVLTLRIYGRTWSHEWFRFLSRLESYYFL